MLLRRSLHFCPRHLHAKAVAVEATWRVIVLFVDLAVEVADEPRIIRLVAHPHVGVFVVIVLIVIRRATIPAELWRTDMNILERRFSCRIILTRLLGFGHAILVVLDFEIALIECTKSSKLLLVQVDNCIVSAKLLHSNISAIGKTYTQSWSSSA